MMMSQSHHPRRMLPGGNNNNSTRKRKQAEADKPATPNGVEPKPSNNRLLAGYLAHEFLTKGTRFGQKFEPDSARTGDNPAELKRSQWNSQAEASAFEPARPREHESYGEVANIMKTDGTHIKGIVNPTELSQWLHM